MRTSLSGAFTLAALAAAAVVASTIPATSQVARPLSALAAGDKDDGLVIQVRGFGGGGGGGFHRGGGGGMRWAAAACGWAAAVSMAAACALLRAVTVAAACALLRAVSASITCTMAIATHTGIMDITMVAITGMVGAGAPPVWRWVTALAMATERMAILMVMAMATAIQPMATRTRLTTRPLRQRRPVSDAFACTTDPAAPT